MAMYDWNRNGKKDMADDYVEYNIYRKYAEERNSSESNSSFRGEGISSFGAFLALVLGMLIQVLIYMFFGVNIEDVPVVLIAVLWVGFSFLAAYILNELGI